MNVRYFENPAELAAAVAAEVVRVIEDSLTPAIGFFEPPDLPEIVRQLRHEPLRRRWSERDVAWFLVSGEPADGLIFQQPLSGEDAAGALQRLALGRLDLAVAGGVTPECAGSILEARRRAILEIGGQDLAPSLAWPEDPSTWWYKLGDHENPGR
ncbi:MAG TPA: hypothetical protein VM534_06365 [Thermoanaerobaculia bacterium]|nr:hypothetical protein [Thermoanaerobaculia bacterium]